MHKSIVSWFRDSRRVRPQSIRFWIERSHSKSYDFYHVLDYILLGTREWTSEHCHVNYEKVEQKALKRTCTNFDSIACLWIKWLHQRLKAISLTVVESFTTAQEIHWSSHDRKLWTISVQYHIWKLDSIKHFTKNTTFKLPTKERPPLSRARYQNLQEVGETMK